MAVVGFVKVPLWGHNRRTLVTRQESQGLPGCGADQGRPQPAYTEPSESRKQIGGVILYAWKPVVKTRALCGQACSLSTFPCGIASTPAPEPTSGGVGTETPVLAAEPRLRPESVLSSAVFCSSRAYYFVPVVKSRRARDLSVQQLNKTTKNALRPCVTVQATFGETMCGPCTPRAVVPDRRICCQTWLPTAHISACPDVF